MGTEVSVRTPFGLRRYDVVIEKVGLFHGIELKATRGAMNRWSWEARQQSAGDRWMNGRGGAETVGVWRERNLLRVDTATKIQWSACP